MLFTARTGTGKAHCCRCTQDIPKGAGCLQIRAALRSTAYLCVKCLEELTQKATAMQVTALDDK